MSTRGYSLWSSRHISSSTTKGKVILNVFQLNLESIHFIVKNLERLFMMNGEFQDRQHLSRERDEWRVPGPPTPKPRER
jgi:hypothetical protein